MTELILSFTLQLPRMETPQYDPDSQLPHLPRISRLDIVPLGLPSVTRNDTKVATCDSEDGASVVRVRVEAAAMCEFDCE